MSLFTSILTAGSNSHQETSENANALASDFVTQGVIGAITNTANVAPMTGAYAVNAQGSPNMTVAISSGVAYVTATPASQNSQTLRVRNTASSNLTIAANASGSTKFDWIYISIDATKAANPASDASDVATLVASRSSNSSTDNGTPPAYGLVLTVVTVANGASSITNGNIADKRLLATDTPAGSIRSGALASNAVAGSNIATYSTSRRNNSSNITETAALLQTGWTAGQPGVASSISIAITFPVAFTNVPIVSCTFGGDTAGVTSTLGLGGANVNNGAAEAANVTTSGFTLRIWAASNWAANNTVYGHWVAIGV